MSYCPRSPLFVTYSFIPSVLSLSPCPFFCPYFFILKNNLSSISLRTHIPYQGLICVLLLSHGNIIVAFNLSICLIRAGMSVFFSLINIAGKHLLCHCGGSAVTSPWHVRTVETLHLVAPGRMPDLRLEAQLAMAANEHQIKVQLLLESLQHFSSEMSNRPGIGRKF